MTVGSLFAGIGGFDLGFQRAGFEIKWQVEIDPFCRAVLARHFPEAVRYDDVKECCTGRLRRSRDDGRCAECGRQHCLSAIDVLCGGFPCQPHSLAGRRDGAEDERNLWPEYARLIRELEPRWVVAENVPGLLSTDAGRFFGAVLRDLAACGYDAEWDCIPASAFGAPHQRDRVWLVGRRIGSARGARPNAVSQQPAAVEKGAGYSQEQPTAGGFRETVSNSDSPRQAFVFGSTTLAERARNGAFNGRDWWDVEPEVVRVVHGLSATVVRRREQHPAQVGALGNSIVPQIAQWIAERIKAAEGVAA